MDQNVTAKTPSITSRIDAITRINDTYRVAAPPCPRSVKIELTARCNYACSFCARSMRLRDQKDMDRSTFHRLALEMREAGVEELGLFYLGESFLIPWLAEAIAYAKGVGYPYVFLTTNGSLATPQRVEQCMEAGLDSLKFSFNYADSKQFADITRVKESYFEVMKTNIKAAHRARARGGYKTGLYASYILYDGDQGARMKEAVAEITPFVDEVYALPLYNQADLVTASEQEKGWKPTAGNRGRIGALRDPLPCWSIFTEGHVTWDGKLSACCFDHDGRFHMGDLTEQGFMDAWNSPKFQALRAAHLRHDVTGTVCEKCVIYN
jgi:MoaA/NifB/PqqE/SkfB family radical SAM enzyme